MDKSIHNDKNNSKNQNSNNKIDKKIKYIELYGGISEKLKKNPLPKESAKLEKWIKYINELDDENDFKKDCANYDYIPSMYPPVQRIIVLGDIHGDFDLLMKSLKGVNIINEKNEWIAEPKDTCVVQVGDQIDSCRPYIYKCDNPKASHNDDAADIKILEYMTELGDKAKKVGGKVINLLGNHEIMNSQGNLNYVSFKNLEYFKNYKDVAHPSLLFKNGTDARKHAFKPGNHYANFMACTRSSSIIIGSWLFVHAAILPALLRKFNMTKCDNVKKINSLIRKWLLGQINGKNIIKLLNSDKISPFWPRILGNIPPNQPSTHTDCKKYVDPVLKTLQIGGIIVGHTPQYYVHEEGINFTCGGKVGRSDIGSSKAFHPFDIMKKENSSGHTGSKRIVQVLEILNDKQHIVHNI